MATTSGKLICAVSSRERKPGPDVMDVAWWASWFAWGVPLKRRYREILVRIFIENPIELRIAWLCHQIRNSSFKIA
jgi:hypothetical protein